MVSKPSCIVVSVRFEFNITNFRIQEEAMRTLVENQDMIAKCGLYCNACGKYLKGKCDGCASNHKASWCKLRTCCLEKKIASCADCTEYEDVMACNKYNTFMAKMFGFIFNSDRAACIERIKTVGYEKYAREMTQNKRMTFKRN